MPFSRKSKNISSKKHKNVKRTKKTCKHMKKMKGGRQDPCNYYQNIGSMFYINNAENVDFVNPNIAILKNGGPYLVADYNNNTDSVTLTADTSLLLPSMNGGQEGIIYVKLRKLCNKNNMIRIDPDL